MIKIGSECILNRINLCVVFGGVSTEHDISLLSAASVIKNLNRDKYNILPVGITKDGAWFYLPNLNLDAMANDAWINSDGAIPVTFSVDRKRHGLFAQNSCDFFPVDCVFPVLHGFNGEDGTIQGLFEIAGIPYVGCNTAASAMSMDKAITKLIISDAGVAQADWIVVRTNELDDEFSCIKRVEEKFTYPVFVKPASTGSSVGVHKVKSREDLIPALSDALKFDTKVLVEEFIDGREIETAVLGNDDAIVSVCGEVLSAQEFYSFDAKYNDSTSKTQIPAELCDDISDEIRKSALIVYKALGASGLSRVDFFLTRADNKIIFNEINTLPGFTSISMYPKLFDAIGICYSDLLDRIVDCAFSAFEEKRKYK